MRGGVKGGGRRRDERPRAGGRGEGKREEKVRGRVVEGLEGFRRGERRGGGKETQGDTRRRERERERTRGGERERGRESERKREKGRESARKIHGGAAAKGLYLRERRVVSASNERRRLRLSCLVGGGHTHGRRGEGEGGRARGRERERERERKREKARESSTTQGRGRRVGLSIIYFGRFVGVKKKKHPGNEIWTFFDFLFFCQKTKKQRLTKRLTRERERETTGKNKDSERLSA